MSIRKVNSDDTGLPVDWKDMFTPTLYWPMVESSLGIVGACLPLLRPIISEIYPVRSIRELNSIPTKSIATSKRSLTDARILEDGNNTCSVDSSEGSIYVGGSRDG